MTVVIPELRALRSPDAAQRADAALALNAVLTRIGRYWGPDAAARRRRDRRIVVALVGALVDDSAAVRAAAGWALSTGNTGRARGQPRGEALRELRALLRDQRPDTRRWAAHVLGKWRDEASLPALRRLAVRDPRSAVRAAAQEAVAGVRRAWISRKATARDQTGHGAVIVSMAMSPDGRTIFTAGWDGTVRAWDVRTGRVTWVCAREDYRGEWSYIDGIALAPDGRTLAIATTWEGVVLFDVGRRRLRGSVGLGNIRGRLLKGITVGGDAIIFCGKSPKSSLGGRGWVRFLDGKGRTTRRLHAPTDVFNVAASPDGRLLAIRTRGWRVFDVASDETILELPEGTEYVTFSRDGALLAVAYRGEGALWDLRSRQLLHTFRHATEPYRDRLDVCPPAFSSGGDLVAFGQSVFETATGALKWRALDDAWTRAAIFSPNDGPIAFAGDRHAVILRDTETGQPARVLGRLRNEVAAIGIAPDGTTVAATYEDGGVRVWDLSRRRVRAELRAEGLRPGCVLFTADGRLVVGGEGGVAIADARLASLGPVVRPIDAPVSRLAERPDGRILVGGERGPFASPVALVSAWDPRTGAGSDIPSPGGGSAASSRDGRWIATWSWRHTRIHDAGDSAAPPRELTLPNGKGGVDEIYQVEFSPSGDLVATGTSGFHLALWDTATWEVRRIINLNGDSVCAMAFSPDGRTLAVATAYASEVDLRDVATGARVGLLDAHTDNARAVAFSPDGATVITGAADGTLRLWDPGNAHLRATLPPPGLSGDTARA
jgi:WD40 repeat protein